MISRRNERGFFARTWCRNEFESRGLNPALAQCSIFLWPKQGNPARHALSNRAAWRDEVGSMHARRDLRRRGRPPSRVSNLRKMDRGNADRRQPPEVYVPEGCGHGFLSLEDNTEAFYQISEFYHAGSARGVHWNDSRFRIAWPAPPKVISERDRSYANFR